ncbi:MAG: hypothetical protein H6727_10090 [Myxococcales bacterium]|nr:hypothetical protein [Myxococcales bacterium]
MFRRIGLFVLFALFCLALPPKAEARRVFLNNVPINSVRNQTFSNVTVKIDAMGNVYITGKQYRVKIQGPTANNTPPANTGTNNAGNAGNTGNTGNTAAPTVGKVMVPARSEVGPAPSDKYVLLIQRSQARASGYKIHLNVNGRLARKISLNVEQDVVDITPFLKKGSNKIVVEAFKVTTKANGSLSLKMYPGHIEGGQVKIKDDMKLDYARKSAEMDNFRHIYTIYLK